MDVRAISFNHQGPVVMKEAAIFGGVNDNVSTTFKKDSIHVCNLLSVYDIIVVLVLLYSSNIFLFFFCIYLFNL